MPFGERLRTVGVELRERGRFEEARAYFVRAIAADRADGKAHRYLIETQSPADPEFFSHVRDIEQLLAEPTLAQSERTELHFALGGALDRVSRYDEAFVHFRKGNELRRGELLYDEERERVRFASLQRLFNRTILRVGAAGPPDDRPIFVIGMPRSGTTLVESLLAAHSDVRGLGELTAFERALFEMAPIETDPRSHAAFIAELRGEIYRLGERYSKEIDALAASAPKIVDKMPLNFRYAVPIHLALPAAKIVHVRRDPLDTCFSCYTINFAEGQEFSYDVGELGRYYALYLRQMDYVRTLLPHGVMLEIDYEEIVADLEGAARRILAHCGLRWDPGVLEYWRHHRAVRTASVVQVREPIYRSSIGRAANYPAFCAEYHAALQGEETNGS